MIGRLTLGEVDVDGEDKSRPVSVPIGERRTKSPKGFSRAGFFSFQNKNTDGCQIETDIRDPTRERPIPRTVT